MSRIMKASILVYSFYLLISFICEVFRTENYFNLFYRTYIKERCHHAVLKAHFEEKKSYTMICSFILRLIKRISSVIDLTSFQSLDM